LNLDGLQHPRRARVHVEDGVVPGVVVDDAAVEVLARDAAAAAEGDDVDAASLLVSLYNGSEGMPAYRFLFEERKIIGESSPKGLQGVAAPGYELVPTERAETLVAYLLSLKQTYEFSEARPFEPVHANEGAHE